MNSLETHENYLYLRSSKQATNEILKSYADRMKVDGLYYGAEFCEHLIPTEDDLTWIAQEAEARRWKIYLVTGEAAVSVVPRYQRLLAHFSALPVAAGVVFNDWGVLSILRRDFPSLRPVMGRLLFKNIRFVSRSITPDGKFSDETRRDIMRAQLKVMRETSLAIPEFRNFLTSLGIDRVDVDILPQGMELKDCGPLSVGAHLPLGYLTSGRTCPLWEKGSRYPSVNACMKKRCLAGGKVLDDGAGEFSTVLVERGNVVLYHVPENRPQGISRWIHELAAEITQRR